MLKNFLNFLRLDGKNNIFVGKKMLVVEDNEIDRKVIVKVLESHGASLLMADTGEVGLQNAKDEGIDCIILDLNLPDMDGHEVCRKLKEDEQTNSIPVIFLTAEDKPQNVIDCYDVGGEYYLTKPINSKSLVKQIKMILDECQASPVS